MTYIVINQEGSFFAGCADNGEAKFTDDGKLAIKMGVTDAQEIVERGSFLGEVWITERVA